MYLRLIACFISFFLNHYLSAQQNRNDFVNFNTDDGLPSNNLFCIFQEEILPPLRTKLERDMAEIHAS